MRDLEKGEITLKQFLDFCHRYTERIKICVVVDHVRFDLIKAKKRRPKGYYLTDNGTRDYEKLVKKYSDLPVWNLCVGIDTVYDSNALPHKLAAPCLIAHCHYGDVLEIESEKEA